LANYIALLRGINVGGHRVIAMADLRDMFAAAGARDVVTYIQSGNVVFAHAARSAPTLAAKLAAQIAKATGFEVPVMLRTAAEWEAVVSANPFAGADTDQLHVSFLATAPDPGVLDRFEAAAHEPERFALVGRELYMHLPDGMGRSKLVGALGKVKPIAAGTARNWRTVLKLHELVS
jgi:uncharacterized protein (DUF1697 family)